MAESETDWYRDWYQRMWEHYNSGWDQFLREYVFTKDPPFVIKERSSSGDKNGGIL